MQGKGYQFNHRPEASVKSGIYYSLHYMLTCHGILFDYYLCPPQRRLQWFCTARSSSHQVDQFAAARLSQAQIKRIRSWVIKPTPPSSAHLLI